MGYKNNNITYEQAINTVLGKNKIL
jgi:hypothetical protein